MKKDSVCAYVHIRHDTPRPLYAPVHILDKPPTFPSLLTYLMNGLFCNQKTNKNIRISHSATCARKPKVPGSSLAASYVQRWALAVIARLMSRCLWSRWKWWRGVKKIPSPFFCCPVNSSYSWKKTLIEKTKDTLTLMVLL